jgi:hypothetical protein
LSLVTTTTASTDGVWRTDSSSVDVPSTLIEIVSSGAR